MGRPKWFTIMQPDTEKSSSNSYESRPKRFKITPATENSTTNSRYSRPKHFKVTPPGAGSISPTKSGACSRPSKPSSNGSGRVVTMPPTQVPDYMYSSDSSDGDDDEEEEVIPTSIQTTRKSCKKKSYWTVSLIDEDGTITEGKLKVLDIWSLPTGKKVIIPCNELGQPIDDAGDLLGGFLGDLGSNYAKFPMCYKSWRKVPVNYKNTVYDDIIQVHKFNC